MTSSPLSREQNGLGSLGHPLDREHVQRLLRSVSEKTTFGFGRKASLPRKRESWAFGSLSLDSRLRGNDGGWRFGWESFAGMTAGGRLRPELSHLHC